MPVNGYHYYSGSLKVDDTLASRWLKDLEENKVIPKGKVTTATLVTHDIEKINSTRK